jgi:hypothetical protein
MQLALRWRRTEHREAPEDDAGVTDQFLSSLSAVVDSLREANEHSCCEGTDEDSAETNRIGGRVLRELAVLRRALITAKELGDTVPSFPPLKSIAAAETSSRKNGDDTEATVASPSESRPRKSQLGACKERLGACKGRLGACKGRLDAYKGRRASVRPEWGQAGGIAPALPRATSPSAPTVGGKVTRLRLRFTLPTVVVGSVPRDCVRARPDPASRG